MTASPYQWSPHLRGHLLLFDRRIAPVSSVRLLLAAVLVEGVRLAVRWLYPEIPTWWWLPVLLGLALLAVPTIGGATLAQLGFHRWREWTLTEKSYFLQVVVLATIALVLAALADRVARAGLAASVWNVFVPYLFFGFYQEVVYRGLMQTALVQRWGAPIGIVVANLLYTFGPLHSYYFASPRSVALPMFASIFGIGLLFGLIYRRSGNLWIVAIFHAIGNAYFVSSLRSA